MLVPNVDQINIIIIFLAVLSAVGNSRSWFKKHTSHGSSWLLAESNAEAPQNIP